MTFFNDQLTKFFTVWQLTPVSLSSTALHTKGQLKSSWSSKPHRCLPFMQIENVCSLLTSILDAFLSKDKTVVIRALVTVRRLLGKLDKVTYSSLCTRIASSYCPLMDHVSYTVRCVRSLVFQFSWSNDITSQNKLTQDCHLGQSHHFFSRDEDICQISTVFFFYENLEKSTHKKGESRKSLCPWLKEEL